MDEIILEGLWFYGFHGVLKEENLLGQRFCVHLRLHTDLRQAGETDDLESTINYAQVYELVRLVVEGPTCRLIERLATKIAGAVLAEFSSIQRIEVQVDKPSAPIAGMFDKVAVKIVRDSADVTSTTSASSSSGMQ